MEAIIKWPTPINFTKVSSFCEATWYLEKFIKSFIAMGAPLHAITIICNTFQWENNQ